MTACTAEVFPPEAINVWNIFTPNVLLTSTTCQILFYEKALTCNNFPRFSKIFSPYVTCNIISSSQLSLTIAHNQWTCKKSLSYHINNVFWSCKEVTFCLFLSDSCTCNSSNWLNPSLVITSPFEDGSTDEKSSVHTISSTSIWSLFGISGKVCLQFAA